MIGVPLLGEPLLGDPLLGVPLLGDPLPGMSNAWSLIICWKTLPYGTPNGLL